MTRSVLIVSASMGSGHDAAAAELARRLRGRGHPVQIVDFLMLPPLRQGELLRGFYRQLVGRAPRAYGLAMSQWQRHPGFFERLTEVGAGGYERPLAALVDRLRPAAVVSTYNLAGQALGRMRRGGRLPMPLTCYQTDPGAHRYWLAAGADAHLVPLPQAAAALRAWGAAGVSTVAPLVAIGPAVDRAPARRRWSLADRARVALVNGGSWGVGEAAATARTLAAAGMVPIVLCGRSSRLAGHVAQVPGARAVPWTDDVPGLLAAADVVVDNAGGTTCWEALAAGRPVVVHRPIGGHGRLNAAALADAGLARWTADDASLRIAVQQAVPSPAAAAVFAAPDAADRIVGLG
ncbi:MAG TPA: glycosyltransferase [Mycobacteriales bacterium]|nr:glycosyltransferase [Mycobacteriales bacterium]